MANVREELDEEHALLYAEVQVSTRLILQIDGPKLSRAPWSAPAVLARRSTAESRQPLGLGVQEELHEERTARLALQC